MNTVRENTQQNRSILVLGGTGKTGRRVAQRLQARGLSVRIGSRAGVPPFDWQDDATWAMALRDVDAAYITYHPDLAVPGAPDAIGAFAKRAVERGVTGGRCGRAVYRCRQRRLVRRRSEQAPCARPGRW